MLCVIIISSEHTSPSSCSLSNISTIMARERNTSDGKKQSRFVYFLKVKLLIQATYHKLLVLQ